MTTSDFYRELVKCSERVYQEAKRCGGDPARAVGEFLARWNFGATPEDRVHMLVDYSKRAVEEGIVPCLFEGRREMSESQNGLQVVMVAMVRKPVEADDDAGIEEVVGEVLEIQNLYTTKTNAEIEKEVRFKRHDLVKSSGGPDSVEVQIARPFRNV